MVNPKKFTFLGTSPLPWEISRDSPLVGHSAPRDRGGPHFSDGRIRSFRGRLPNPAVLLAVEIVYFGGFGASSEERCCQIDPSSGYANLAAPLLR